MGIERVNFSEYKGKKLYIITGEKEEGEWRFYEQSSLDLKVKKEPIDSNSELCQKAEEELEKQYEVRGRGFD